jgi:transmembrane sensor
MTRETPEQIEAEAARWVMRLDASDTPDSRAALQSWLAGDDRRKGALLQAEAASMLIGDALRSNGAPIAEEEAHSGFFTRRRVIRACAAALVAAIGIKSALPGGQSYRTTLGEVRRVPLTDGSIAVVNTQSDIVVTMNDSLRKVDLIEGEAWFQVAHDKTKPFIVESGASRIRAVGTAFSVRRQAGGSDVVVTEGVVEAWAEGAEHRRIRLSAGERGYIADGATPPAVVSTTDNARTLAWREGKIDLAGEPLSYAAEEFNRYNGRKLVIVDPALGAERLFGVFQVDDPEGFAIAVHDSLKVPVQFSDPGEIRIGSGT